MTLARCNTIEEREPQYHVRERAADLVPDPREEEEKPVVLPATLLVINIIQGILGLAVFGFLLFLRYDNSVIRPAVRSAIQDSVTEIEPLLTASDTSSEEILTTFDLQEALAEVTLVLIPVGFVILFPVLWGIAASVSRKSIVLIVYLFVLLLFVLGEISFLIIYAEHSYLLEANVKTYFSQKLIREYGGDQVIDNASLFWNAVMLTFSCCGVNNGGDFVNSNFKRDVTLRVLGRSYTINNLVVPLVCCKHSTRTSTSEPGACAKEPLSEFTSHFQEGCYDMMAPYLQTYKMYFLYFVIGLCVWQIISFIMTLVILRQLKQRQAKECD